MFGEGVGGSFSILNFQILSYSNKLKKKEQWKGQLTGPKDLESMLEAELSPSTQQCPLGTFNTSSWELWVAPIQSPGKAIILFMCFSLWLLGELQKVVTNIIRLKCWHQRLTKKNNNKWIIIPFVYLVSYIWSILNIIIGEGKQNTICINIKA